MKKRKRKWTVVGFYADNDQPWVSWVETKTVKAAVLAAINKLDRQPGMVSDMVVVDVFAGHKRSCLCNEEVLCAAEIQELRESEGVQ